MRRAAGFTLVELLVALFVFALISAAGVMLLSGSVSAQGAARARLDDMAATQRAMAVIGADLAQAVPRISRTEAGTLAPAFYAAGVEGGARPSVQFVRAGRENLDDAPRSTLEKLEYWVVDGRLERRAYPEVDGAPADPPAVLIEGVTSARFRFRDDRGEWRRDWTAERPDHLPRAVELELARGRGAPLTMLFLVGPGMPPKPDEAANG